MKKERTRPILVTVNVNQYQRKFKSLGAANYWLLNLNDRLLSHFDFRIENLNTGHVDQGRI